MFERSHPNLNASNKMIVVFRPVRICRPDMKKQKTTKVLSSVSASKMVSAIHLVVYERSASLQ